MSTSPTTLPTDTLQRVIDGTAALNAFIGLGPDQLQAIAVIGYNSYEQGKIDEAEEIFQGLIALDGTKYFGYAGLGAIELSRGNVDAAHGHLSAALQRHPDEPTVLSNLGEVLLRQGKAEEAATAFQKALALDPDGRDPGANRARAILQGMNVVLQEMSRVAGA
ncbi:MAG: tetratricopeptide repeat protein [Bryobacterales bacterium]|nr:tetratricopeptide repeat protein [Bryobacterales bacterium]